MSKLMSLTARERKKLAVGLAFIGPNIAGFLIFILFPLVFSLAMAFTNWDLRLHNIFKGNDVRFVGLENFVRLFREPDFFQYLGNTLFLMMAIPFSVAGSLFAAILLSQDLRGGDRRVWGGVLACAGLVVGTGALVMVGAKVTAMLLLVGGVAGIVLIGGVVGGRTVHRTLFYFPHFTAGVATFLLWKKLYSPHTGPVNHALRPILTQFAGLVTRLPVGSVRALALFCAALSAAVVLFGVRQLRRGWRDGEIGGLSIALGSVLLFAPVVAWPCCGGSAGAGWVVVATAVVAGGMLWVGIAKPRDFTCTLDRGLGHGLIVCGALMVVQFALLGLGNVFTDLPAMSADGLNPPEWLTQYSWAKPSIMIMGFWAAIGSNNMLLYLAGLSNIPVELYEAADIDGASRVQRFWNVTWPQLAPVTFFILVMAVIHGLQGGFEMARTMTRGGPAGSTTTLSYYVYTQGFETGRLGYASAVAWTLFALVFLVTLFNWKFGNRYTND